MSGRLAISLEEIAECFEGMIPSTIATVDENGVPNVTFLSIVHRLDSEHVALSRQFFKKTDDNTVVNPYAQAGMIEPSTGRMFHLDLVYERTETEGPLFERMRTHLDAVAAHEGMSNIFRLRGVDVCRVIACEPIPTDLGQGAPRRDVSIERVESFSRRIAEAEDMEDLLQATLRACEELLRVPHAFIMLVDEGGDRLYTVASTGFTSSGAGSEVRIGEGLIGLAAARRQTIRVTQMARDLTYSHAAREAALGGRRNTLEHVIPLPSLPSMQSQIAAPMLAYRELAGVICAQSPEPGAFRAADECVVGILANQVAISLSALGSGARAAAPASASPAERPVHVKHYREDDSVFIDNEYLIKGVAGGILWRLLRRYHDENRSEFSNREIRLDQSLDLPDIKDNLEARLILLRRRLEERCDYLRIEKVARGRFRLVVTRPLVLAQDEGGGPL